MRYSAIPESLDKSRDSREGRAKALGMLSIALFLTYSSYLFYLQVIRGSEYRAKATTITRQTSVIPAQRGEIYDRAYSVPLVLNTDSFAVDIVPALVPPESRDAVFTRFAEALGIGVEELRRKVPPSYYHLYQAIEVRSSVPYSTITSIAERIDEFPGVSWHSKPVRNYLETGSISHVIGYVGDITRDELKLMYNQGYKSGDVIGKDGIEKQYDMALRGREGREYKTVDVIGKNIESGQGRVDPPVMGSNIVLTIDVTIQRLVEKALGERIGSAIVLRPATGEILSMVSYPWYNPNAFTGPDSGVEYAKLIADPTNPLINRAMQSSYPPASTFKTVLTAGVLEDGVFPPDQTVLCAGEIFYGDRPFRCHIKKPGHGWLDLMGALEQSCDIYFWTVGRDYLGVERIVSYAKEFGFGQKTGIDLPGEIDEGFVPTPQWKDRRFHEKWLGGDTMNLAIGQGFLLATPLQVADMMAMIVNDGVIYRPHLIRELRDPGSGAIISSVEPEVGIKSQISAETFAEVKRYLRGVITDGTARFPVDTEAVAVAGKTGTAEVGLKDRWHSWFAAYGPFGAAPEDTIVVVVMVEAANPWEWWAPYASNIIFQGIFAGQSYDEAVDELGLRYMIPRQERAE